MLDHPIHEPLCLVIEAQFWTCPKSSSTERQLRHHQVRSIFEHIGDVRTPNALTEEKQMILERNLVLIGWERHSYQGRQTTWSVCGAVLCGLEGERAGT